MNVRVDASKCQAYGNCADHAPTIFTLDEWGYASVAGDGAVAEADQDSVRRAVTECPALAVIFDES